MSKLEIRPSVKPSGRGGAIGLPSPYNPGVRFRELDRLRVAVHQPQVLSSDDHANRAIAPLPRGL
jgi:hypothetical protein